MISRRGKESSYAIAGEGKASQWSRLRVAAPKASLVHPRKEYPQRAPERLPSAGEAALGSWAKRGMGGGAKSGQSAFRITLAPACVDPAFSATRVCWQGARDPCVVAVASVIDMILEAWRLGGTGSIMVGGCLRNAPLKIQRIPLLNTESSEHLSLTNTSQILEVSPRLKTLSEDFLSLFPQEEELRHPRGKCI